MKLKINIALLFICLAFYQCTKKSPSKKNYTPNKKNKTLVKQPKEENPIISKGDYYFKFDEIIHYKIKKEINPFELNEKNTLTKEEQLTYDYFFGELPKDLKNKSFIKDIELRYDKAKVDTSRYRGINEIFREIDYSYSTDFACIPEYRDILIFKKKKKIVGLAKICFTCMMNHILGTSKNTDDFGQGGDYERLKKILYQ